MFAQLKERFLALKEFHAVQGLHWRCPDIAWRLVTYIWIGTVLQELLEFLLPIRKGHVHSTYTNIETSVIATVVLLGIPTALNLWHNLPRIIAFLRDPTFENE
jgi:hypothetical protein